MQTQISTHDFHVSLSLLSAVRGNVTCLVRDAAFSHVPGKTVFLLISYKTDFHIAPECAQWASKGQPGFQAQPAWVHEKQVLLAQPDLLL